MKKILTLFVRDPANMKLVTDKIVPGLEWVLNGTCTAREKLDGTACMIWRGRPYKRYTTAYKTRGIPFGFIPSPEFDFSVAKWPGWIPVGDGPDDRWHREAFDLLSSNEKDFPPLGESWPFGGFWDGTYELIGPKVQGNPYGEPRHVMCPHNDTKGFTGMKSFRAIREALAERIGNGPRFIEGLVFWGPEGPVCKIKRRDFGLPWPVKDQP